MGGQGVAAARRQLVPHPSSVSEARRLVRNALTEADREDLLDNAELLVSEIVTNAVVHAGTSVDVTLALEDDVLRVEVVDSSPHLPVTKNYSTLAGTGRGLRLLEELVDRWGVLMQVGTKTVWFELSARDPGQGGGEVVYLPGSGPTDLERESAVDVELRNVPLLLHAAWQMHADSLLREYLLARLGDDTAIDEIENHAAANDAMALLQRYIPEPDVGEDPEALMAAATEPLVSAERLVLRVPEPSLEHFRLLGQMLDAAAELADAGTFLTPATQPEVRLLRRWLCGQVEEQSQGASPTAWDPEAEPLVPPDAAPVAWDPAAVATSPVALIAADDTNRVLAVSRSALEILGYDEATELVGRRLVEIIPTRFRQAHLAGFTLHLSVGRAPLIGNPVVVPALRRDGSETSIELTVEAQHLPGGRRLFVGELREAS